MVLYLVILLTRRGGEDDNIVTRRSESDRKEMVFKNKEILSYKKTIILKSITKPVKEISSYVSHPNIGVIDTETFIGMDGIQKIYSLEFKTNLDSKAVIYYIDRDSFTGGNYELLDRVILDLLDELFKPKYKDIKFYCHKLGGFYIIFVIGVLIRFNMANKENGYNIDYIFRDKIILNITISRHINGIVRKIHISDSYAIVTSSQKDLCLSFEVESNKTDFPYKFLHQDNLLYVGNTPEISFYNNISLIYYKSLFKCN